MIKSLSNEYINLCINICLIYTICVWKTTSGMLQYFNNLNWLSMDYLLSFEKKFSGLLILSILYDDAENMLLELFFCFRSPELKAFLITRRLSVRPSVCPSFCKPSYILKFFSKTSWPNSTTFGTMHPYIKVNINCKK